METDTTAIMEPQSEEEEDGQELQSPSIGRSWNRYAAEGYQIVHNNNEDKPASLHSSLHLEDGDNPGRSKAEKQLCVLLIVSVLVVLGLLVALVVVNFRPNGPEPQCNTADCVILSGTMLSKMGRSVDPCKDFYEYSCAAYVNSPLIPPSSVKYGNFAEVEGKIINILKRILDEPGNVYRGVNSSAIWKAKTYYETCLNKSATEDIPDSDLLEVIRKVGSWPILSDSISGPWDNTTWDITQALGQTFRYIGNALFVFDIGIDQKDSTKQRFQIDQGGVTFKDYEHYKGNNSHQYKDVYVKYFTDIAKLLGSADDAKLVSDVEDVWNLEVALAKAFDAPKKKKVPTATLR